jgi:LysR family transcriptional regulator, transcriptional activator of the cysJI operon
MTLRQLEVFLAVAREKSFSLAAKKIRSSQPTLSEHVSELETELGKQLFFRRGRRRVVTVTEAGRVFAEFAERAISAIEGGRQALADLDGLTHGSLLIGASTTPGLYVLPRIIAAFRTKYPGVDVKLQIANSQAIEGRVRERELDLGIVGGHALRPGEECLTAGMRDELVLIVAPEHAWARRRDITPDSLADHPLLVREEGSATRSVTERALQRARVKFRVAMELDHTEAIKQGVMAGLGVAFVSLYSVRGEMATGRLHALRLRGVRIQRHFHVIHHEARRVTASARAFMEFFDQTGRGGRDTWLLEKKTSSAGTSRPSTSTTSRE